MRSFTFVCLLILLAIILVKTEGRPFKFNLALVDKVKRAALSGLGIEPEKPVEAWVNFGIMLAFTLMLVVTLGVNGLAVWQKKRPNRAAGSSIGIGIPIGTYTALNIMVLPEEITLGYSPFLCIAAAVLSVVAGVVYLRERLDAKIQVNHRQENAGPTAHAGAPIMG